MSSATDTITDPVAAVDAGADGADWKTVCRVEDIPRQGSRVLKRAGHPDIAVFRTFDDHVFAMIDRCPHKGGPLSQGIVMGASVTCPLHGLVIDFETAKARAPDTGCTHRIPVRLDGQRVQLDLGAEAARPALA